MRFQIGESGDDETATALCARFATVSDGVKGWTRTLAAEVRQRQAEEVEDSIGGDDCAAHLGELRRGLAVVDKLSAFCSARSGASKGDDFEVIARYFREHLDQRLDCRRFIDACAYREWALCTRQSTPPRGPLEEAGRRRERRLWNLAIAARIFRPAQSGRLRKSHKRVLIRWLV